MDEYTYVQTPRPKTRKSFKWRHALGIVVIASGMVVLCAEVLNPAEANSISVAR